MNNVIYILRFDVMGYKVGGNGLTHLTSFRLEESKLEWLYERFDSVLESLPDETIKEYDNIFAVNAMNKVAELIAYVDKTEEFLMEQVNTYNVPEEILEELKARFGFDGTLHYFIEELGDDDVETYAESIQMPLDEYEKLVEELYSGRDERGIEY